MENSLLNFFSKNVVEVDIRDPIVAKQIMDIMKIFLDLREDFSNDLSRRAKKVSTFKKLNKNIFALLRANPLFPHFKEYLKKNSEDILKDFGEEERVCRIKALQTLLKWESSSTM